MTPPVVEALGWSLIHSLWECSVIALLLALFNLCCRGARARYAAGCLAMLLMFAAPLVTFLSAFETHEAMQAIESSAVSTAPLPAPADPPAGRLPSSEPPFLEITVWLWLSGVVAMSAWSTGGWVMAQRLKRRGTTLVPDIWRERLASLASSMRVRAKVRLQQSIVAQAPTVIGWLRPVILVPASALLQLSAAELEAVLAHELAHIRRRDYLMNLLQTAIETLLFYHPAVWWAGKRIRVEREHCCDDLAVAVCGDRMTYARALTSLEELRSAGPQFVMAAAGGDLLGRIRRLLGTRQPGRRTLPLWLLAVVPLVIAIPLLMNMQAAPQTPAPAEVIAAPVPAPQAQPEIPATPAPDAPAPRAPIPAPQAQSRPAPDAPAPPAPVPVLQAQARPAPTPAPAVAPAPHHEGYLGGLADAGYTNISVDEIIELKQNGVSPEYIRDMLHAGFGTLSPKELISLKSQGVPPDYARAVKSSGIRDITVADVIRLRQNGVHPDLLAALAASGYNNLAVSQIIQANANGLSPGALRSIREQGFKNLSFEQVMKLKRAGVI